MHTGGGPEELYGYLKRLRELRRDYGREGEPFQEANDSRSQLRRILRTAASDR
jgi:hypothetical protein